MKLILGEDESAPLNDATWICSGFLCRQPMRPGPMLTIVELETPEIPSLTPAEYAELLEILINKDETESARMLAHLSWAI